MDMLYRLLFILGYVLLVPSLTVFWYMGGRHREQTQQLSLTVMTLGMVIILLSAQPYR